MNIGITKTRVQASSRIWCTNNGTCDNTLYSTRARNKESIHSILKLGALKLVWVDTILEKIGKHILPWL